MLKIKVYRKKITDMKRKMQKVILQLQFGVGEQHNKEWQKKRSDLWGPT